MSTNRSEGPASNLEIILVLIILMGAMNIYSVITNMIIRETM